MTLIPAQDRVVIDATSLVPPMLDTEVLFVYNFESNRNKAYRDLERRPDVLLFHILETDVLNRMGLTRIPLGPRTHFSGLTVKQRSRAFRAVSLKVKRVLDRAAFEKQYLESINNPKPWSPPAGFNRGCVPPIQPVDG